MRRGRYLEGDTQRSSTSSDRRAREAQMIDVPEVDMDDVTGPVELLLDDDIKDEPAVARLRSDSRDPYALIFNLATKLTEERKRERKSNRLIAQTPRWRWIGGVILVPALGALATAIGLMVTRAEHEGEVTIRLQRLEQDVQLLLREERSHRYSPAPSAPKDPSP